MTRNQLISHYRSLAPEICNQNQLTTESQKRAEDFITEICEKLNLSRPQAYNYIGYWLGMF